MGMGMLFFFVVLPIFVLGYAVFDPSLPDAFDGLIQAGVLLTWMFLFAVEKMGIMHEQAREVRH